MNHHCEVRAATGIAALDIIGGPQVTHLDAPSDSRFRERHRGEFAVPLAASALLLLHCLIALALIPPWQQPDEPTFVTSVEAAISRRTSSNLSDPGREAEILQSMARYDWWGHRRRGGNTPEDLATNFQDASARGPLEVGASAPAESDTPTYALLTSRIVSQVRRGSVVDDLYWLRALSAIAGLLTLWVAWLSARETLGTFGGAMVAMLLALHPQFAIVSTAASPDAFVNLAGACVWWQAALAARRNLMWPLATMWAAVIIATSFDRMAVPLSIVALCASALVGIARAGSFRWRTAIVATAIAIAGLAATVWAIGTFGSLFNFNVDVSRTLAVTWLLFARFNWAMHQTWWFSPGWGMYGPPLWWTLIVAILSGAALTGTVRRIWRAHEDGPTLRLLVLAVLAVAIQVAAVYGGTYFQLGVSAQGRYLFPVLVPSLVILWAGLETWVPPAHRAQAAAALIVLLACLDAAAWGLVAIPAYYASV